MTSFDDLRKSSRRPEAVVSLCLRGDLFAERARLQRQLADAKSNASDSLTVDEQVRRTLTLLAGVESEMSQHTYDFTFRALPGREYRALEDQHPPDPDTMEFGRGFFTALVCACLTEPALTEDQLDELDLTDGQLQELEAAALRVNREAGIPFSPSASPPTTR